MWSVSPRVHQGRRSRSPEADCAPCRSCGAQATLGSARQCSRNGCSAHHSSRHGYGPAHYPQVEGAQQHGAILHQCQAKRCPPMAQGQERVSPGDQAGRCGPVVFAGSFYATALLLTGHCCLCGACMLIHDQRPQSYYSSAQTLHSSINIHAHIYPGRLRPRPHTATHTHHVP